MSTTAEQAAAAGAVSAQVRRARGAVLNPARGDVARLAELIGDPPEEIADLPVYDVLRRTMNGEVGHRRDRLADLNRQALVDVDLNIMLACRTLNVRQRLWLIDRLDVLVDGRLAHLRQYAQRVAQLDAA